MSNYIVKNKKVFKEISCPCSTYLCHWENYSNKKAVKCSALGCSETRDLVGGHVILCHGNALSVQYITPLCNSCNSAHNTECFELKSDAILVNVTARNKCKKCS
jgi:hypothetical protein